LALARRQLGGGSLVVACNRELGDQIK
jgi:hypothetical protein